jgi:hypothetical protein
VAKAAAKVHCRSMLVVRVVGVPAPMRLWVRQQLMELDWVVQSGMYELAPRLLHAALRLLTQARPS